MTTGGVARDAEQVQVPSALIVRPGDVMDVTIGAAAGNAPQAERAHADEHRATGAFGTRSHGCRNQHARRQRENRSKTQHRRVATSEPDRCANHARAPSVRRAIDGERGNGHQVICAQTVKKPEHEGRQGERKGRHPSDCNVSVTPRVSAAIIRSRRMARVLIVEDSADIAELIKHYLERAGYETTLQSSGRDALLAARQAPPDLVILDVMLPGMDGMQVCQALRAESTTSAVPILMLTARGEEADRVRGLELGADDYVTKPFSPKELVARVQALLRRADRALMPSTQLQYGPIGINLERHEVRVSEGDVKLTAKEFLLLQYLLEHRGRVLSRDRLLTDVWGYQYTGGTRTVDVHVRRLREKIPFLTTALSTVKQFGYKLDDPPPAA